MEYVQDLRDILGDLDVKAFDILKHQMGDTAKACAKRRRNGKDAIHVGDWVLELKATNHPLRSNVNGPFLVRQLLNKGSVVLSTGSTAFKEAKTFTRHISKLAKFYVMGET